RDKNKMAWKWGKGAATTKPEFGTPTGADGYTLCVYDAGGLISTSRIIGSCTSKPCWSEKTNGWIFKNKSLQPSGVQSLKLIAGIAGKATLVFKGKGASLALPDPSRPTGPLDVQLRTSPSGLCWGAHFSAPFQKQTGTQLKDKSD